MAEPDARIYELGLDNSTAKRILLREDPFDAFVIGKVRREMKEIKGLELGCCAMFYNECWFLPKNPKYLKAISPMIMLHGKWKERTSSFEISFQLIERLGVKCGGDIYVCRVWSNIPAGENGLTENINKAIMAGIRYDINT